MSEQTKPVRIRKMATVKFRQPPPIIDLDLGYENHYHPTAMSITEAQQLHLQLQDVLAQAERERRIYEQIKSGDQTKT